MKSVPTLCGSISGSIGGLGVVMHNAAYQHLNLPYTYVSFQPSELEGAIGSMRTLGIRGMGVTMPYKKNDVIQYLDSMDTSAKKILEQSIPLSTKKVNWLALIQIGMV